MSTERIVVLKMSVAQARMIADQLSKAGGRTEIASLGREINAQVDLKLKRQERIEELPW